GRTFLEFVFASRAHRCFAMLSPRDQLMPRRATLLTVFTDGAVVFTKNYRGGIEADEAEFFAGAPISKFADDDKQARQEAKSPPVEERWWPKVVAVLPYAVTAIVCVSVFFAVYVVFRSWVVLGWAAFAALALRLPGTAVSRVEDVPDL